MVVPVAAAWADRAPALAFGDALGDLSLSTDFEDDDFNADFGGALSGGGAAGALALPALGGLSGMLKVGDGPKSELKAVQAYFSLESRPTKNQKLMYEYEYIIIPHNYSQSGVSYRVPVCSPAYGIM